MFSCCYDVWFTVSCVCLFCVIMYWLGCACWLIVVLFGNLDLLLLCFLVGLFWGFLVAGLFCALFAYFVVLCDFDD